MSDREPDATVLLDALARLETTFPEWPAPQRAAVEAYREATDALHGAALRQLVRLLKADPASAAALRRAAGDPLIYAVLRHHGIVKPSLDERVETALAGVRPALAEHAGDVEIVSLEPPRLEVRFIGACESCPASTLTFRDLVQTAVRAACPEITEVVHRQGAR
jgi:Fe-S cluster biogenesis protein NfuA